MNPVHNKPSISKCIVSFSHNRHESRLEADRISKAKARREIAEGKKGISHLILRARDDKIDRLKFLFLINGIPIMCYALANLLHSTLREIVVIGSPEVERILNYYLDIAGPHGKSVTYVREDPDNLSLVKTLVLGKEQLALEANELVLFQPGDLPFMFDIEKVIQDEDIERYNLIMWLNSKQKMFPRFEEDPDSEFVQRNYHYRALYEDIKELHDIKEPNVYPINLTAVEPDIIKHLHSSRKDGNILKAGVKKALSMPARLLRLLPILAHHFWNFPRDLERFRKGDRYQFGSYEKDFCRGASILLNTPFTTKLHDDPSFVSDVDALEDWEDFESLTDYANELHGPEGLARIYPYGEELLRFRESAMPKLKSELPIYGDFPSYLNDIYRTLEMAYVPYDNEGRYVSPNARRQKVKNACLWYSQKVEALKVENKNIRACAGNP